MAELRSAPRLAGRAVRQGLGLATMAMGSLAQNLPVPPLPYSYGSLVPFISEHALRVGEELVSIDRSLLIRPLPSSHPLSTSTAAALICASATVRSFLRRHRAPMYLTLSNTTPWTRHL